MALNENARKWVAALRSGEYQQARNSLRGVAVADRDEVGYCCLGVACEVFMHETGRGDWREGTDYEAFVIENGETHESELSLPLPVQEWLGLRSEEGTHENGAYVGRATLSLKNDQGATFDEIADIIERESRKACSSSRDRTQHHGVTRGAVPVHNQEES